MKYSQYQFHFLSQANKEKLLISTLLGDCLKSLLNSVLLELFSVSMNYFHKSFQFQQHKKQCNVLYWRSGICISLKKTTYESYTYVKNQQSKTLKLKEQKSSKAAEKEREQLAD